MNGKAGTLEPAVPGGIVRQSCAASVHRGDRGLQCASEANGEPERGARRPRRYRSPSMLARAAQEQARSTHLTPHLIPLLNGTLHPPAQSIAFDKVTDKARDKVASLTCSNWRPSVASGVTSLRHPIQICANLRFKKFSRLRGFAPSRELSLLLSTKSTKLPTKLATKWRL